MKHSSSWYRKKCVARAKEEAKARAGYTCERCGRSKKQGYAMHGSHILPEGAYISMSADSDNILCLCYLCHFQWWHKNPLEASAWFKEKYGSLYTTLRKRAQKMRVINWKSKYE